MRRQSWWLDALPGAQIARRLYPECPIEVQVQMSLRKAGEIAPYSMRK
jgi:hypothetical protein